MKIDLRECKMGDKVCLRSGFVGEYVGASGNRKYPHLIVFDGFYWSFYTDDGFSSIGGIGYSNIVKIIPLKPKRNNNKENNMKINLTKCKRGDKVILRSGEDGEYVDDTGNDIYPHRIRVGEFIMLYTDEGSYYCLGKDGLDIVKVIPFNSKPEIKEVESNTNATLDEVCADFQKAISVLENARFNLGEIGFTNTEQEVDKTIKDLRRTVNQLR